MNERYMTVSTVTGSTICGCFSKPKCNFSGHRFTHSLIFNTWILYNFTCEPLDTMHRCSVKCKYSLTSERCHLRQLWCRHRISSADHNWTVREHYWHPQAADSTEFCSHALATASTHCCPHYQMTTQETPSRSDHGNIVGRRSPSPASKSSSQTSPLNYQTHTAARVICGITVFMKLLQPSVFLLNWTKWPSLLKLFSRHVRLHS